MQHEKPFHVAAIFAVLFIAGCGRGAAERAAEPAVARATSALGGESDDTGAWEPPTEEDQLPIPPESWPDGYWDSDGDDVPTPSVEIVDQQTEFLGWGSMTPPPLDATPYQPPVDDDFIPLPPHENTYVSEELALPSSPPDGEAPSSGGGDGDYPDAPSIPDPGRVESIVTFDFGSRRHTFVGKRGGRVRDIRWMPKVATADWDMDFDAGTRVMVAGYAGETGAERHLVIATADNRVFESTVTAGNAATTPVLFRAFGSAIGDIAAVAGFTYQNDRYVAVLDANGDVFRVRRSDGAIVRVLRTYAQSIGGPRYLAAYVRPSDGQPRLVLGPVFGGVWQARALFSAQVALDPVLGKPNLAALSAHVGEDGLGHVAVIATDGYVSMAHVASNDAVTVEPNFVLGPSGVVSASSFVTGGRQHLFTATASELRWIATGGFTPDNLVLDRFDPATGEDDRLCLPGGDSYFYINDFWGEGQGEKNVAYLPYPDYFHLYFDVSHGGPASTQTVYVDNVPSTEALRAWGEPTMGRRAIAVENSSQLVHWIFVSGPCGNMLRVVSLRPIAPRPPRITQFWVTPENNGSDRESKIINGQSAILYWSVQASRSCALNVSVEGKNFWSRRTFAWNQGRADDRVVVSPNEKTTYALKARCVNTGLEDSSDWKVRVYVDPGAPPPQPIQHASFIMQFFPTLPGGRAGYYANLDRINGSLRGFTNPNRETLLLIKQGKTANDCSDPNAVIVLGPGQSTTNVSALYGVSAPPLYYGVGIAACVQSSVPLDTSIYRPQITYDYVLY